ncbi:MAG: nucleotidyl transferase AbiEii/AbiGii toxin family protein [Candidatus Paceibacterota bacterium]
MPNFPEDDAIATVFKAISISEKLSKELILKGGNALAKVFSSVRASVDLDFTDENDYSKMAQKNLELIKDEISNELNKGLRAVLDNSKFEQLVIQKSVIKPNNLENPTFPAIEIKIGYSESLEKPPPFSDVVKIEISLNDLICEKTSHKVENGQSLKVSSIHDILSEKLRSLIQQKEEIRDRYRPNDVFDIWFYHKRMYKTLDYTKISKFLIKKSKGKIPDHLVRKHTFINDPEIKERANVGFESIKERVTNVNFPTFEDAYSEVLKLVTKLDIPD